MKMMSSPLEKSNQPKETCLHEVPKLHSYANQTITDYFFVSLVLKFNDISLNLNILLIQLDSE